MALRLVCLHCIRNPSSISSTTPLCLGTRAIAFARFSSRGRLWGQFTAPRAFWSLRPSPSTCGPPLCSSPCSFSSSSRSSFLSLPSSCSSSTSSSTCWLAPHLRPVLNTVFAPSLSTRLQSSPKRFLVPSDEKTFLVPSAALCGTLVPPRSPSSSSRPRFSSSRSPRPPPGFFVVAREEGASGVQLPIWACDEAKLQELRVQGGSNDDASSANNSSTSISISSSSGKGQLTEPLCPWPLLGPAPTAAVTAEAIKGVPGAFMLHNVLSSQECGKLGVLLERLGFHPDAPVSLPRSVRHMDNVNWVVPEAVDGEIWRRVSKAVESAVCGPLEGMRPCGLNARFRFYRYRVGDYFKPHTDGSWPGSRVRDGRLVRNAYPSQWSQLTFLLLLSDQYQGGSTVFHLPSALSQTQSGPTQKRGSSSSSSVSVRTPMGSALCFPHGASPQHAVHEGERVEAGIKLMLRTEVMFPRNSVADRLQQLHNASGALQH